ncbi:MAG TPA: hypothetical protein DCF63_09350 [Planctomycetaceae bacterium]|nr:hypothetical protein [Planctomycetaceae bacterium]
MRMFLVSAGLALSWLVLSSPTQAAIIITDNFEVDTSANYTRVSNNLANGSVAYAFDYIAAGIPLAPRSSVGEKGGVRIAANTTAGATNSQTLFHNLPVTANEYILKVDAYMAFSGGGTTTYGQVGVGGNGSTFNSVFTPISGSGSFMAFTGDGGSASDYRWFLSNSNGGPTTFPNSDASHLGRGSNGTHPFFTALFPNPQATVAGSPGNMWTTVEVHVNNTAKSIKYYMTNPVTNTTGLIFDNTVVGATLFTGNLNGQVSLSVHDAFTSISSPGVFTVYDNLEVNVIPEPSSALLLSTGLAGLFIRRRRS